MANEALITLAIQLVQVELELKMIHTELESADRCRRSELHFRLSVLVKRHNALADSLETLTSRRETVERPMEIDVSDHGST